MFLKTKNSIWAVWLIFCWFIIVKVITAKKKKKNNSDKKNVPVLNFILNVVIVLKYFNS